MLTSAFGEISRGTSSFLFLLLSTTKNPGHCIKTNRRGRWEVKRSQAGQGTQNPRNYPAVNSLHLTFCFIHPRLGTKQVSNTETLMTQTEKKPREVCSLLTMDQERDRKHLDNNLRKSCSPTPTNKGPGESLDSTLTKPLEGAATPAPPRRWY